MESRSRTAGESRGGPGEPWAASSIMHEGPGTEGPAAHGTSAGLRQRNHRSPAGRPDVTNGAESARECGLAFVWHRRGDARSLFPPLISPGRQESSWRWLGSDINHGRSSPCRESPALPARGMQMRDEQPAGGLAARERNRKRQSNYRARPAIT